MPNFYPDPGDWLVSGVLVLLTFIVCGASVALCWVHLARVARVVSGQIPAIAMAVKRLPPEHRVDAIMQKTGQEAWAHRWALALSACPDADARVAVTNELLLDLAHELSAGSKWPASATRTSLLGATLFAVLAVLAGAHVLAICGIVATGAACAIACAALGMGARNEAARQRKAVDSLVDAVLGQVRLCWDQPAATPEARPLAAGAGARPNVRPSRARRWHGRG